MMGVPDIHIDSFEQAAALLRDAPPHVRASMSLDCGSARALGDLVAFYRANHNLTAGEAERRRMADDLAAIMQANPHGILTLVHAAPQVTVTAGPGPSPIARALLEQPPGRLVLRASSNGALFVEFGMR